VPADLPFDRILIDTPDVVVFVAAAHVFPSVFCFTLGSRLRPTASPDAEEIFAQEFDHGHHLPVPAAQAERALRLGVRFADGRAAALNPNYRWMPSFESEHDTRPTIHTGRTSSDTGVADCEVWVTGLPAEGHVTLYSRWLALDIPEAAVELDGDALREASARAVVLWDVPTDDAPQPQG
jgi:hypothetical protein